MSSVLSEAAVERYCRQIVLPEIGARGQERLTASRVGVLGLGPLGAAAATYLALAGTGELALGDEGVVGPSDAGGGFLYRRADLGRPRRAAAMAALATLAPGATVRAAPVAPASAALAGLDLVVDATGDVELGVHIDAACRAAAVPHLWVEVYATLGRLTLLAGHREEIPCLSCVLPAEVPAGPRGGKGSEGLLAAQALALGALAAVEALKVCLGIGRTLAGRVLHHDARSGVIGEAVVGKRPDCPACGVVGRG